MKLNQTFQVASKPIAFVFLFIFVISACKKQKSASNEIETNNKWEFVESYGGWYYSDFHEDKDGNVVVKSGEKFHLFNANGTLKTIINIPIPNGESMRFTFMKDGSFYTKTKPVNSNAGDFILLYKRNISFDYSNPMLIDLRKTDSLFKFEAEYYIHDIVLSNLDKGGWDAKIFASKYKDVFSLFGNKNAQAVVIDLEGHQIGKEYLLPKEVLLERITTSNNNIVFFNTEEKGNTTAYSYDERLSVGSIQFKNTIVPDKYLFGNLILKREDGYYLSDDGMTLGKKLKGIKSNGFILSCKDSMVNIYQDYQYSTYNAYTGQKIFQFEPSNSKNPLPASEQFLNSYFSKKGIFYLVSPEGILVVK